MNLELRDSDLKKELEQYRDQPGYAEADTQAANKKIGTYKVLIIANAVSGRTYTGRMELAKAGSGLTANGDVTAFICRGCWRVVDPEFTTSTHYMCPNTKCHKSGPVEELKVDVYFRGMSAARLAKGIEQYWRAAQCNASVYLVRLKHAHMHAMSEASKQGKQTLYESLRKQAAGEAETVIYTLDRITQDNLSGKDMRRQFQNFLQA